MGMGARGRRLGLVLALVIATATFAPSPGGRVPRAEAAGADFYPETGHTLSGPLRTAWRSGGGLWVFGYPISEPMRWATEDGTTVIAQYFERARLEYHPEYEGTQYRVLGGLLGNDLTADRRSEPPFLAASQDTSPDCIFFAPTRHNLCTHFRVWWESEGGLPVFGYPISEPFDEGGFEVQYFERARLEYHPEFAGTDWEIELGHLGRTDAERRGLQDVPAFAPVQPATVATRRESPLYDTPGGEQVDTVPAGASVTVVGGPSYDNYQVSAAGTTGWIEAGDLSWSVQADSRAATSLPLSLADAALDAQVAESSAFVSVAIYDPLTNQLFEGGTSGPVAAASLAKALLLTIAMKQSEAAGNEVYGDGDGALTAMIEFSDNDAANAVWSQIGGAEGVDAFLDDAGLSGFSVPDPWDWGAISATAGDWARFFGLLGSGQLLNPANTALALGLMHDEIEDHRFGVLSPGEDLLSIGKNGWYLDESPIFDWRVNSAGLLDTAEGPPGIAPLAVVMMSLVPGDYGMDWGASMAQEVQAAAVRYSAGRWAEYFHRMDPSHALKVTAQGGGTRSLATEIARLSHLLNTWSD